jgi:thiosulfate/3-mercaptopyruvate sulfurtransferase
MPIAFLLLRTYQSSSLVDRLPSADVFAERVSAMGIDQNSHVVVYTQAGCFSAARCWWTFRVFGCDKVSILDGGLPAWEAAGGEVESGKARQTGSTRPSSGLVQKGGNTWLLQKKGFQANLTPSLVKTSHQVLQHSAAGQVIVDARSVARFRAQAPEPRPGLVGGHIPGSLCVPATEVLQPDDPTSFKSKEEIRSIFEEAGVHLDNPAPIITTCGSGVTAAVLSFAMHLAGRDPLLTAVYDGSWSEWGDPARTDLPKVADE